MINDFRIPVRHFNGRDGVQLAFREIGDGRPLLLFHGFTTTAEQTWIIPGYAAMSYPKTGPKP